MVLFDYSDLNISACAIQDMNQHGLLNIIVMGSDSDDVESFIHLFSYDYYTKEKKDILFEHYATCKSREVSNIIMITSNDSDNCNGIYYTDSCLWKIDQKGNWDKKLIDEEIYDKIVYNDNDNKDGSHPYMIGLINRTAMKVYDLAKESNINTSLNKKMIYPGKKNLINDFIVGDNRIVLCSDDNKVAYFDIREYVLINIIQLYSNQSKFSIKHLYEFNQVVWNDSSYETFIAYSKSQQCLCYFDYRKLNKWYNEDTSIPYENITKLSYNHHGLFILEYCTNQLLIQNSNGLVHNYESKHQIIDFSFDSRNYFLIIQGKHSIEVIKNI